MSSVLNAYTRAELDRFQYYNLESATPSNLNNAIHPIYSQSRWTDCPDDAYELLTRSLRLASLMITSPTSLVFYDALMNYHRRLLNQETARLGKNCYRFRLFDSEERDYSNAQTLREVSDDIAALRPHIRYKLIPNVARESGYLAVTRRDMDVIVKTQTDWPVGTGSTIDMGIEAVTNLRRVRARGSVSQLLRLQFSVAVTFAHELVHAVNHAVSMESYEPFFEEHRSSELGLAWEQVIFGGRVITLRDIDARDPLGLVKWPTAWRESRPDLALERRLPKKTSTVYFVPMTYIANIQQQGFWANLHDGNQLRIPKRHGRQMAGDAPFDPDWASEDSSEGQNRGGVRGRVTREDLQDNWEDVEEVPSGALDWDDLGFKLPRSDSDDEIDEDIELTRSMIDEFEKDMGSMDI